MTTAYPLAWPQGFPRTKSRNASRFKTTVHQAVNNVTDELRRFGNDTGKRVESTVISSNVTLTDTRPADPGIAVYFVWDGVQCCIAIDRYPTPMENLQAVSLIVEAERAKMRHGGLNIVRASFRGFASLPPPDEKTAALMKPWRDVLGVQPNATLEQAKSAYFRIVKVAHPDVGGDAALFNRAVDAWRQAQEELRA
jgi:hypothetical protein